MSKTTMTFSRRAALGAVAGATAAVAASPLIANAATGTARADTVLSLKGVPLAYPQFRRTEGSGAGLRSGQSVTLRRERRDAFDEEAISVFAPGGRRIGYIPRRHNAALSWAMERGEVREARISRIASPVVNGVAIPGWGSFHLDVEVARAA